MSRSHHARKPRYTGYGIPIFHEHGSRRALIERQDERSAIAEQIDEEPLADWERELLYGPVGERETYSFASAPRPRNPFAPTMPPTIGFIPGTEHRPSQAERDRLAAERKAKQDAWIESANKRRADRDLDLIRSYARPTDPAKRISTAHRIRVTDVALMVGLTNVQTIYLLNTVCKEFVPHANATVASIVATDLLKLVTDEEGGGRMLVATILRENGMGDIA